MFDDDSGFWGDKDSVLVLGEEEGNKCNRDGCDGIIEQADSDGCSCHINPPCSACMNAGVTCPKCEWMSRDE